jgi:hypothetical protein
MPRSSLYLVVMLGLASGCMQPVSGQKQPSTDKRKPAAAGLEQLAFDSFQARDRVRAEKLRKLKGIKYDVNRQEAIEAAGAEASRETWGPVAAELSRRLDSASSSDTAEFDRVLEELARGAERAGK